MKYVLKIFMLISALLITGRVVAHNEREDHDLSPSVLSKLKRSALNMDAESSWLISQYYFFSENNFEDGVFWLRLSAELGSCKAQARLGQHYLRTSEQRDKKKRASYWLELSRQNGCAVPKNLLDEIN